MRILQRVPHGISNSHSQVMAKGSYVQSIGEACREDAVRGEIADNPRQLECVFSGPHTGFLA
jgi:hypothetical protein